MKFLYSLMFMINALYANGYLIFPIYRTYYTLSGQIIYPYGSQISIEPDSRLIVELQDLSVTTIIARKIIPAIVFPVIFNISYAWNQITRGHLYVLNARIFNRNDELCFINEKRFEVRLLGAGRTTFIDISVMAARQYDLMFYSKIREWPELVGTKGDDAVNIIKQQTGFKQVFIVTDDTQVSKDLRYDRVCIYVDSEGKVAHVPRIG